MFCWFRVVVDPKSVWQTSSAPSTQTRWIQLECLVVSLSSLCGHPVSRSVIVCLCISGSLWRTSSLEKFVSYWNGFQRYPIMPRFSKWVILSLCYFFASHSPRHFLPYLLVFFVSLLPKNACCYILCTRHYWLTALCFFLQVMELQSLQSYKNKAVPSAALLFVYLERANALPVSLLCNLP